LLKEIENNKKKEENESEMLVDNINSENAEAEKNSENINLLKNLDNFDTKGNFIISLFFNIC
jgi:hypothetical protein